jgi:hypothetical protein
MSAFHSDINALTPVKPVELHSLLHALYDRHGPPLCLGCLNALDVAQPFVQLYTLALGKGPSIFMTTIAGLGLIMERITSHSFPHTPSPSPLALALHARRIPD